MAQSSAAPVPQTQDDFVEQIENDGLPIPDYLEKYYWWAYVRPWAIWTFERDWMINLILWGWYNPLRRMVQEMMGDKLPGKTIKISCCYGKLEPELAERVAAGGGTLDIVDVAPEQLKNSRRKTRPDFLGKIVNQFHRNSVNLEGFADNTYDRALIFFLPHEQPVDIRRKTFQEAFRVLKPGAPIYVVEFARSKWWHPLRYIWYPILYVLEPFARDMWRKDNFALWLPSGGIGCTIERKLCFGDFYQIMKITTPK